MVKKRISRVFKDISLSFTPHPVTKDLTILKNENAIKRSVRNLIQTIPTERFFDSRLGTDIRGSLFENFQSTTVTIIEDQIRSTIRRYESRVDDIGIEVDGLPDRNALEVKVIFTIDGLETPPQEFSFILEPTR